MSLVPDPESSYMSGLNAGFANKEPYPDNHFYQQAYMKGWHDGRKASEANFSIQKGKERV